MAYATSTVSGTYPARDLMAAAGPVLTSAGYTLVESYNPPVATPWTSTAYGNGVFVAVATGSIYAGTSPDGVTWTKRAMLPASYSWTSVAYGNGVFVAVATGSTTVAATSPDGITWTQRALPAAGYWQSVIYAGGQFVTVGNAVTYGAMTSPDGITWTARSMLPSPTWLSVAYGNGLYVAVGNGPTTATSPDGVTWTQRSVPANGPWNAITYGAGLFVVVGSGTSAYTSPDGINWTVRNTLTTWVWSSVVYGGGKFVAVGTNGTAATSPDAITWTLRALPGGTTAWTGATYTAAYGWLAVSNGSTYAMTSPDAVTWTLRTMSASATSPTADVYKSPAAGNGVGDWYLILRRTGDLNVGQVFYQVAEKYDPVTHLAANYGGTGGTTGVAPLPTPGTFTNPALPMTPELPALYGSTAFIATAINTTVTYWISATPARVIITVRSAAAVEGGAYAGLYEDVLPAGTTGFPLVAARFPTTFGFGPGSGSTPLNAGGFTREPLQQAATNLNFEASILAAFVVGLGQAANISLSPMTTAAALYGNPNSMSRVVIGSARSANALGDLMRGLLYGCLISSATSAAGDTTTFGGKTYVRVTGPTTALGYWVETAL